MNRRLMAATLLVATCAPVAPGVAATTYSLTPIDGAHLAYGINDAGQVVGQSEDLWAYVWTSETGLVDLGDLPGNNGHLSAKAVSATGQVVGSAIGVSRAFRWTDGGGMQDLGVLLGQAFSFGEDINLSGQVVGYSGTFPNARAYLWTSGVGMQDLGDLPGGLDLSQAKGINDAGQVVGLSVAAAGYRAFLWAAGSGMQDLGVLPGGDYSEAFDINNAAQVVGQSRVDGTHHAFLWTAEDGMLDLGMTAGGSFSRATAISELGVVVGVSGGPGISANRAFVWTSDQGMHDLNDLVDESAAGWTLRTAQDINSHGQIVGWGSNPLGEQQAFLLTPVPEPSTLALALLGAAGLVCCRRRQP